VLTDSGLAALTAAAPGHVGAVRELLFDQLTDQQVDQLREICEAALQALTAADPCCERRQRNGPLGKAVL